MRINRLEIDNFMALGSATVDLENKGLVLIQGENCDDSSQNSNGSGKSTLIEALSWALYNDTARGDSGDAVINRTAKKECRVLVQLVDDDRVYNVIRHRKHAEHKNRVLLLDVTDPMDVIDLTAGTDRATQDKIQQVIGCSVEVFRAAVYYGQEQQIDLPSLTDKSLKVIVEEAAGIDKMQEAHSIARAKLADVSKAQTQAEHELEMTSMNVDNLMGRIDEARRQAKEFEVHRTSQIKSITASAKEHLAQAKALSAELKAMEEDDLDEQLNQVQKKFHDLRGESSSLHTHQGWVEAAKSAVKQQRFDIEQHKKSALASKKFADDIMSQEGTPCENCGEKLTADHLCVVSAKYRTGAKEAATEAKRLATELPDLEQTLSEARDALAAHEASMTNTDELETQQSAILARIKARDALRADVKLATERAKREKGRLDDTKAAPNPHTIVEKSEAKRLLEAERKRVQAQVALNECNADLSVKKAVVDVFAPSGIRAHILDTVTPFLNERTAQYLGVLSDGNIQAQWSTLTADAKGTLKEKFAITVRSDTGGHSYKSLSGGEKRKVRLATALALQDLVSSRATKPIELWVGDEIDDAVDVAGLERLMTVLEEKAKEKGSVLIISHNELSDWCSQHAVVTKKGGKASISGVLNIERETIDV